ncbi:MAG: inositol monophosphatase [Sulfurospirillaceae bacterium]|nr:inositol monophosphatase [Sulfurospirillaceae bacterium]
MNFINAVISANKEIYLLLRANGLQEEFYRSFCKGAGGDISVGIDIMAENIFIKHLQKYGTIISEEVGEIKGEEDALIIIDPIDGSENLVSGIPYYGTSVAYTKNGKCTQAVIVNLANAEIFIKDGYSFTRGFLGKQKYRDVCINKGAKVGIFERSYCSKDVATKLKNAQVKYRSPGAFALSLAYAHDVSFVLYEGKTRIYDISAGEYMCENLFCIKKDDIFLVSKDKEIFDKISNIVWNF